MSTVLDTYAALWDDTTGSWQSGMSHRNAAAMASVVLGRDLTRKSAERAAAKLRSRSRKGEAGLNVSAGGDPTRDPELHFAGAPDGYELAGVSKWDADANAWIKTRRLSQTSADREELLRGLRAIADDVRGIHRPRPAPACDAKDVLVVNPWGDPHSGAYAHAKKCGLPWDLAEFSRAHRVATEDLIDQAPAAARFHLLLLGDNIHAPNNKARTPKSGHPLDTDGTWEEAVDTLVTSVRDCVSLALSKFSEVSVAVLAGNHEDYEGAFSVGYILHAFYAEDPRVTVDRSQRYDRYLEWGTNLLGATHGDGCKMHELSGVMPAAMREAWGRTSTRYWFTGHTHSDRVITLRDGSIAESMRPIAPKDAYAARHLYPESMRTMKADRFCRRLGRRGRIEVNLDLVDREAAA